MNKTSDVVLIVGEKQNENNSLPTIGFLEVVVKVMGIKPGASCMSGKKLTTELLPRARQAADH